MKLRTNDFRDDSYGKNKKKNQKKNIAALVSATIIIKNNNAIPL